MRGSVRLLIVAGAALATLAVTSVALAAFGSPKLIVTNKAAGPGQTGELSIRAEQVKEDDAPFRVTIYVPQGYTPALTTAQDLAQIGTVTAQAQANAISPDAIIELTGVIRIDTTFSPAEYPAAAGCLTGTGVTAPVVVFRLELSAAGQNLVVPMYLALITGGPEAAFAQAKLIACLASPYIPTSSGGAVFGAKLINATLVFPSLFASPTSAGEYRWRSIWTPWTVGGATPNAAGTVETQAVDALGRRVTLRAGRYNARTRRLALSGTVTEGGKGVAGSVQILQNGRRVATVRSAAGGAFSASVRIARRGSYTFRANATVAARETSGCTASLPPVPCLRSTAPAFTAASANVRVRIR